MHCKLLFEISKQFTKLFSVTRSFYSKFLKESKKLLANLPRQRPLHSYVSKRSWHVRMSMMQNWGRIWPRWAQRWKPATAAVISVISVIHEINSLASKIIWPLAVYISHSLILKLKSLVYKHKIIHISNILVWRGIHSLLIKQGRALRRPLFWIAGILLQNCE